MSRIIDWKCPSCYKISDGRDDLLMKICMGCQVQMIRGYEYGNKSQE